MREIKFRAWDKKEKKMLNDSELDGWDLHLYNLDSSCGFHLENEYGDTNLNELELMQYTGLKDKNGKEIYEGDIICIKNQHQKENCSGLPHNQNYFHNEVKYEIDSAGFPALMDGDGGTVYQKEIIGNIYENPELLK